MTGKIELECLAWRLLVHEVIRVDREGRPGLCAEAQALLGYFEQAGVPVLDIDHDGREVWKRQSPRRRLRGICAA
jgi:hypothetical protein